MSLFSLIMDSIELHEGDRVCSPNSLKRKPDHETLEAGIKRVALDDNEAEDNGAERAVENAPDDIVNYINLRMLCLTKEASKVVGGKGERVNRIKSETNTRINVSDNIAGVLERVIFVRGSCEDVAKAFGKIVRAINNENENASTEKSLPLVINLLIPHHYMGCIIGRQGSRLHQIEDLSAARLFAAQQQLPMSNDRILSLTGVADAIHIATYYIGQTILENEQRLKLKKTAFYHPGPLHSVLVNNYSMGMIYQNGTVVTNGLMPIISRREHHQSHPTDKKNVPRNSKSYTFKEPDQMEEISPYPLASRYEIYKHVRVVPQPEMQLNSPHLVLPQEIFIADNFVGNVIGKGGKNIQKIKQSTGCMIKIDDPAEGLTERKLVLVGTSLATQSAITMINNRIDMDKRKKQSNIE